MATNLAVPGLGSLVGGRKIGLAQLALYFSGFLMTIGFGVRFVYWSLTHWSEFHGPAADADPVAAWRDLWQHIGWPCLGAFLGVAMCFLSYLWALGTSRSLLAEKKQKPPVVAAIGHE